MATVNDMGQPDSEYAGNTTPPESEDQAETTSIPISMIGGMEVKPGDTISLKVVSVDQDSGSVNVVYDDNEAKEGGSDGLAGEFNNQ